MLPKQQRIPIQEFIRKKPTTSFRGDFFLLQFFNPSTNKRFRCSVLVSKRVSKQASGRNRIRRAVADVLTKQKKAIQGDILCVALPQADTATKKALSEDMASLFRLVIKKYGST